MRYIINGFDVPELDFWVRVQGITTERQRYQLLEGMTIYARGRLCQMVDDGVDPHDDDD